MVQADSALAGLRQVKKQGLIGFVLGALLVAGFSPFDVWPLGILCPAGFLALTAHKSPRQSAWIGFCFGLGLFGVGVSWVFVSIATYGNTNIFVAGSVTFFFVLLLALFPALQGYLGQRFFTTRAIPQALFVFPGLWAVSELLRSHLLTGFPWLLLGYTQSFTVFAGFARLASVFFVSWITACLAGILFLAWQLWREKTGLYRKIGLLVLVMLFTGAGAGLRQHEFTHPVGQPLSVALVQGNVSQSIKWSPTALHDIMMTYAKLTGPVLDRGLIVWPENAIPDVPEHIMPFLDALDTATHHFHGAIVLGLPIDNPIFHTYFNGALAFGDAEGMYLKRHLVPFGEYVPLHLGPVFNFLHIPMSDFSAGPSNAKPFMIHGLPVQVLICYESAYPLEVRLSGNVAYLITLSDDSWFGRSLGAPQHEEMEVMRSIETGRPILRATNSGVTSVIDANGHIVKTAPMFTPTVLTASIQPVIGYTPWLICGIIPFIIFLLLSLGLCFRKKSSPSA